MSAQDWILGTAILLGAYFLIVIPTVQLISSHVTPARHRTCRPWRHHWEVATGGASGFLSRCTRCHLEKVREW